MVDIKKTIGIALGGGGSLGSYEMGVWTALRDLKIQPDVITGTSIGALIGAFMAANKYEVAHSLWQDVSPEKVMKDGLNFDWVQLRKTFQKDRQKIITFTKRYIKNRGADITPFIELIKSSISPEEIKNTTPRFGIVAVELPFFVQRNIEMRNVDDEDVYDWLFASSAIWPLFPVRTIKKKTYIDGGYKDTLPIRFAFKLGAQQVIAVNLFYKITWHPLLNRRQDVINVEPSWNLGAPFNFDQAMIDRNRSLGYNDTMKKIGPMIGYRYTFKPTPNLADLEIQLLQMIKDKYPSQLGGILRLLKRHTKGRIPDGHLFLRGLEVIAETLKISPEPIYEISKITQLIYDMIDATFVTRDVVSLLRKIKERQTLTDEEELGAINALKYVLETQFHGRDITNWISYKSKYILTYVMLLLIQSKFINLIKQGAEQ